MVAKLNPVLKNMLGDDKVIAIPPLMGSEDFHHLVIDNEKKQYHYIQVGTAKPEHFQKAQQDGKAVPYSNHNADYQVDLDGIALGTKVGATSLLTLFAT